MSGIYCIKEKKKTADIDPSYVRTKNNRLMLKAKCGSCGIIKTKFVKEGGKLDIHKAMLPLLPKKGLTLPGYKYCGPGNPLDNGEPTNELDQICMEHDYCYSSQIPKSECDKRMLGQLSGSKSKTFGEKVAKNVIVKPTIYAKHKLGLGKKKKWSDNLADELHKPIKRKFPRRSVIVSEKDEIWSADLVDMQAFSSFNKGFKYILTVIDIFSKFAWAIPIKDKTGKSVTQAFEKIIGERVPKKLWVDEGKEFYNSTFIKFLDKHKIYMYSTFNEGKAVVIERFNRTLKRIMWKYFTANNTRKYLDVLDEMIKSYNEKFHSTIKMPPNEASKDINQGKVYFNIVKNQSEAGKSAKYKKGDKVRISKYKRHFEKGYTPNWTEEIFVIDKINKTNPVTYQVKDLNNEQILGSFYEQELTPAEQEIFRISKIIRRDNKNKKALVKWVGYSDKHNSWVPFSDLINL